MGLNIRDLAVSSPAFDNGGRMPDRSAFDKGNDQPEIRITGVPDAAVELALICHDPDAPLPQGFTHWLLYGIPPDTRALAGSDAAAYRPGLNDFGSLGYGGPQPPAGHGPHHYYFWIYALDTPVEGTPSRAEFLARYADHIIEQNRLVGVYEN
ncbi:MAG: YbhB/YbcL family Raf kinase inhibitor-like protein [Gammaproteobacteria bacterium]